MLNTFYQNQVYFYDEDEYSGFVQNDLNLMHQTNTNSVDQRFKGSVFINNIGKVLDSVDTWRRYLPKIEMFFNISANSDPVLIRILNSYGIKFSCSTGPEIESLIDQNVLSSSIIYSGLCKLSRHIRTAAVNRVDYICFGTVAELKRIVSIHPKAKLFLRFNVQNVVLEDSNELNNFAANGVDEITNILQHAHDLNAHIYGLYFDLPDNSSVENYQYSFQLLKNIIYLAKECFDFNIECVNIGSGVPLFDIGENSLFTNFVNEINKFSDDYPMVELIAEPGEFVIQNAINLCCSVIGKREVFDDSGDKTMFYYLNDGLYGSLSNILYHQYQPDVFILKQEPFDDQTNFDSFKTCLWGPTCDSMDKICTFDDFPCLDVGDLVFFKNVGLYSGSCASTFNGFDIPQYCHVISYQSLELLGIDRQTAELSRQHYLQSVIA